MCANATPEGLDDVVRVDLCIVGAGLAGLNALAVATRYLSADQRVALVDRRPGPGGMWIDTYPYVRLHQPYRLFTAGDIAWKLRKPRNHLATRSEVLDHLTYCRDVLAKRVRLDEFYGWSADEDVEDEHVVRVVISRADGARRTIETPLLINAFGFDVTPKDPLPLSSSHVRSVSPDSVDLDDPEFAHGQDPVWIVGGGKTAMDTAAHLIGGNPDREVNLIAGSGMVFNNREKFFPNGIRRFRGDSTLCSLVCAISSGYDGTNEDEVLDSFRRSYGLQVTPTARNYMSGNLSPSEAAFLTSSLARTVMGHLDDVVDTAHGPELLLRTGERVPVPPDSWVINCTGYLLAGTEDKPARPYRSVGGRVVTISTRSAVVTFSSYASFYLTHLAFLDRLDAPLYALDMDAMQRRAPHMGLALMFALTLYNVGVIAEALPIRVLSGYRGDFERWYPLPQRIPGSLRLLAASRRSRDRTRAILDDVTRRIGVTAGPLV